MTQSQFDNPFSACIPFTLEALRVLTGMVGSTSSLSPANKETAESIIADTLKVFKNLSNEAAMNASSIITS